MTTNQYRAVTKAGVAAYGDGVFEAEYPPAHEADLLASGVVELVPRPYRVLVNNYRLPEGEVFDAVYPVELEAALIAGGVIERVRRNAHPTVTEVVDETAPATTPEPDPNKRQRRTPNPKE